MLQDHTVVESHTDHLSLYAPSHASDLFCFLLATADFLVFRIQARDLSLITSDAPPHWTGSVCKRNPCFHAAQVWSPRVQLKWKWSRDAQGANLEREISNLNQYMVFDIYNQSPGSRTILVTFQVQILHENNLCIKSDTTTGWTECLEEKPVSSPTTVVCSMNCQLIMNAY